MTFNQADYDIRCEWSNRGLCALVGTSDVVIIVDVLSFSTCVEIATTRGATVFPYQWKDTSARRFACGMEAELAEKRGKSRFSLSPTSFLDVHPTSRIVLPSPNGASLSLSTRGKPTLTGCLRNAAAVAQVANQLGCRVAVIPAGELWPDGSLRPSLEDWLGAGAIIDQLVGSRSPEAQVACESYQMSVHKLEARIRACGSGRELINRGYEQDIILAAELNVSEGVPILIENAYVQGNQAILCI